MTLGPSTTRPLSLQPQKLTGNRMLLVETDSNNSNLISSTINTQPQVERYTLQEVPGNSPTCYYSATNLSYSSSSASTLSTFSSASTASSRSQPTRYYTPPSSPIVDTPLQTSFPTHIPPELKRPSRRIKQSESLPPSIPSWTNRMDRQTRTSPFSPRIVSHTSTPLGWIRPSLTPTALLDPETNHNPSYFVFLGFGPANVWQDLFDLKGPMPLDRNGTSERTFLWKVEQDRTPVMCTLATLNENLQEQEECPYLENLILNRVGVTSILVALPIHSTEAEIMTTLNKINTTIKGLDPQSTWYEHLVLIFYPPDENRTQLIRTTLPHLMHQISPLPCILVMAPLGQEQRQTHHRILYQQASMHQTDHGWWHGSTAWKDNDDEDEDDDDDDDDGLGGILLPMTKVIGKKAPIKKKKPLFTIDTPAFLSSPPPPLPGNEDPPSGAELKHRFSKKWTEPPRRHQSRRS